MRSFGSAHDAARSAMAMTCVLGTVIVATPCGTTT